MAKRKRRASLDYGNTKINDKVTLSNEMKVKQEVKKVLIGPEGYASFNELDIAICRPPGYSERIFKYGSLGRVYELYEEVQSFLGIKEVRAVFKNWIKAMNLTISSVSNTIYPEKSGSYLSTILNVDNKKTYSDKFVNDVFNEAKKYVELGLIKIDGETIRDKNLMVAEKIASEIPIIEVAKNETEDINKSNNDHEEGGKEMNYLIITNFATKKQKVVSVGDTQFKAFNDFFECIKEVSGIKSEDLIITPLSTEDKG